MDKSLSYEIVDAQPSHYPGIILINESAVPHVNSITEDDLATLAAQSTYFRVVLLPDDAVAGFLLVLREGQNYQSLNYRWFSNQYETFAYVDRIVVTEANAVSGLGKALYQDLIQSVESHVPVITCEVNLKPVNERSLNFHRKLGFAEVGQQETEGGSKTVCLMARESG